MTSWPTSRRHSPTPLAPRAFLMKGDLRVPHGDHLAIALVGDAEVDAGNGASLTDPPESLQRFRQAEVLLLHADIVPPIRNVTALVRAEFEHHPLEYRLEKSFSAACERPATPFAHGTSNVSVSACLSFDRTSAQSPGDGCRKTRMVGYQGLSVRLENQRQSAT